MPVAYSPKVLAELAGYDAEIEEAKVKASEFGGDWFDYLPNNRLLPKLEIPEGLTNSETFHDFDPRVGWAEMKRALKLQNIQHTKVTFLQLVRGAYLQGLREGKAKARGYD